MGMRIEDRSIVAMMATQIYCARVKLGGNPNPTHVAGEAVALLNHVDYHLPPAEKKNKPIHIAPRSRERGDADLDDNG